MRPPAPAIAAARRHLEAAYGLALEGLGDDQIAGAVEAAADEVLADPADAAFLARVVDRLPIDESWLFREDGLWEWLRDEAGPALLEAAAAAARPVRVLSLGCAGGQEPFSAAILFQALLERGGIPGSAACEWARVVGLDPSPARVEAARAGVLPGWSVQRARSDWLRGKIAPEDEAAGRWRVDPAVRAMCRFEVGNLLDVAARGNAALGGYDLVLCRHVLIYFRRAEAERLAAALARGLDPGATLVFSAAEAHLLAPGGLAPLGHLGAGRAGVRAPAPPRRGPGRRGGPRAWPGGRGPSRSAAAAAARAPRQARPDGRARDAAQEGRAPDGAAPGAAIDRHIRGALEHAHAGRTEDALREARAALFHDPRHLYSRMLLGRHLIGVDAARGREVLRDLLAAASALPPDEAVPSAD
ncbi:MAG TPA: CheR family methyltransferase, partial [Anaeromyxobacter sp.]|nr:CheR family methyltransferase [Anaeromyxobacter sp.]